MVKPGARREVARWATAEHHLSKRRAAVCGTVKALAVGYVVGEGLGAAVTYFDLDPRLIPAIEVAQVAVAALATRGGCFTPGTIVWVQDTVTGELMPIAIEDALPNDEVLAYNPETGAWEWCTVVATHELAYDGEFTDVTYMVDGMGPLTETVSATGNHPFWVQSPAAGSTPLTQRPLALHHTGPDAEFVGPNGGRWVQARHLTPGDRLLLQDGRSATVCGLTVRTERTHVYNLTVERLHNYAVGSSGVVVHNGCVIKANAAAGRAREVRVQGRLEGKFKDASVQREQYLRNADGSIARDPQTGLARRVDHAIIQDGRGRTVETTSRTAPNREQLEREQRIRDNGGTFVRDRRTRELVDTGPGNSRVIRID